MAERRLSSPRSSNRQRSWRIGSVRKLLTVATLLRLAEEGRLHLDDPASRHIPDFPHGGITLRQLAGHLGGIRHYGRRQRKHHDVLMTAKKLLAVDLSDRLPAGAARATARDLARFLIATTREPAEILTTQQKTNAGDRPTSASTGASPPTSVATRSSITAAPRSADRRSRSAYPNERVGFDPAGDVDPDVARST
jgi:CubicO group peptidase (beta-lactamase class C family)